MKISTSGLNLAAIAIVGILVSAPGSTHTAYAAAMETVTAAIAAPIAMDKTKGRHIAAIMPSPSIDERALAPEHPDLDIVSGRRLYANYGSVCHGVNLEGEPNWRQRKPNGLLPAPPLDAKERAWHHADKHLFDIVKKGAAAGMGGDCPSAMIGFGELLQDRDIRAVLAYITSRWPKDPHRGRTATAKRTPTNKSSVMVPKEPAGHYNTRPAADPRFSKYCWW